MINSVARFLRTAKSRFEASPLAQRVLSGAFWSLAGSIMGKGISLMSSIVAARLLGKTQFGEFGMIQNTIGSFGIFAGAGLGLTATKYVAEFRTSDPYRVARVLTLSRRITFITGTMTAFLVFGFADRIASNTLAAPHLASQVRVASLLLLLGAINTVQQGALSGFEAFRTLARIAFFSGVLSFIMTVVGVAAGGLTGAVWAAVGTLAISSILYWFFLRAKIRESSIPRTAQFGAAEWRTLWEFSLPSVLSSLSVLPVNWICTLILVNEPNGYAQMGLLNAAIQWRNIILFVPSTLISVCLPMLTSLGSAGEFRRQRKVLLANVGIATLVGGVAAAVVSMSAKHIMRSYGADFSDGDGVLMLQAFAAAIAAIVGVLGQYLISSGGLWLLIALQAMWGSVNIGVTWMLKSSGAAGLSAAYLAAYVVHLTTMSVVTYCRFRRQQYRTTSQPTIGSC